MVEFCKICIMPNSRPRITFDKDGICNACNHSKDKEQINWELRKAEFLEILSNLKKIKNRNKLYDCVVPWSGSKDLVLLLINLNLIWTQPFTCYFFPINTQ